MNIKKIDYQKYSFDNQYTMLIGDKVEKDYFYYYSDTKTSKSIIRHDINEYDKIKSKKYFDKKQCKHTKSIQQLFNSDDNINANITITSKNKKYLK